MLSIQNNRYYNTVAFTAKKHIKPKSEKGNKHLSSSDKAGIGGTAALLAATLLCLSSVGKNNTNTDINRQLNPSNTMHQTHIDIYDDDGITTVFPDGHTVTFADTSKTRRYVEETIDEYRNIHNEVWDNFPALYEATKDNVEYQASYGESDGVIMIPHTEKGHRAYYLDEYSTITKIAACEKKPWENVKTGKDAAKLLNNILQEAQNTHDFPFSLISQDGNITEGEYKIIKKVIKELENINDETKEVAEIYKKHLLSAKKEEEQLSEEKSFDALLDSEEYSTRIKRKIYENEDQIERNIKALRNSKKEYYKAKEQFLENKNPEDVLELAEKFQDYFGKANLFINNIPGMSSTVANPTIVIRSENAREMKNRINKDLNKLNLYS